MLPSEKVSEETISFRAAGTQLAIIGVADTETAEPLAAALAGLHRTALATSAKQVTIDLGELEFASSTAIKEIVSWLQVIMELAPDQHYRVAFKSTPKYSWQARSLRAIAAFAGDTVQIL
jgi:hypothetical protein